MRCLSSYFLCALSYYVSLRSEYRVVVSITISAYKRCSVRLYLQLFVGRLMSYLRFLCLLAHSGVQCTFWCVFVFVLSVVHSHFSTQTREIF